MKLELNWVEFKNFYGFGNKWQRLDFEPGIHLIIGYNKDQDKSNGAGKTNLLETIVFGLFGKTTKDVNKPRIVNWKNKKKCEVRISFNKGETEYTIHRGLKPNFIKIFKDGSDEPEDQLSNNKDIQKEIENNYLRMDFETFIALIHCNSSTSQSIFNVAKTQKRHFIERLFGLETYSELVKTCNEKLSVINTKITDIKRKTKFNESAIKEIQEQNTQFHNAIDRLSDYTSEIDVLNQKLIKAKDDENVSKDRLRETKEKKKKVKKLLSDTEQSITSFEKKIYGAEQKIGDIKIENVEFDDVLYKELKDRKATLETEYNLIDENSIQHDLDENQKEIKVLNDKIKNLEIKISKLDAKLEDIPDFSDLLGKTMCPTCYQEIDIDKIKESTQEKMNCFVKEKEKENLELETELLNLASLKEQGENLTSQLKRRHYLDREIFDSDKSLSNLEYAKKIQKQNSLNEVKREKLTENINEWNIECKDSDKNKDKYTKMIDILETKINELEKIIQTPKTIRQEIKELNEKQAEQKKQRIDLEKYINNNKLKIANKRKENIDNDKEKDKLQTMIDYLDYIKKLCKDENVKQYAISNIVPYLNQQANTYLAEAGFGFYLKLDSWLDVEIKGPGIHDAGFGNLSSGQQKSTNLAMMLSFLDISKMHASIFPDILLFDEILDSAIDSQSIEKIMHIIKKKQKEDNTKIFIVSHRKEINEVDFDKIYKVTMENGFSKIKNVQ